ncbi:site-specific DNA-methyltransferase [Nitratiruptor sp. YY09-18]|uniref:site-specific DNA-methyltransferase n=1 Tax=Nitratiruptor sp. YY09-18 TaxID=2724901 RepID=UPI001915D73C|nr:site-specific DNA-methyltransferase [Nitratiruptor sp. YY09-18]BCD67605.1 adenine-specific DNA-methyltransferase [Nitratiruptor sp. YY09-18]
MQKLHLSTKDLVQENIQKLAQIFPNVIKEGKVNFELLNQEISDYLIDGCKERYGLNWVGKKESIVKANTSINKTLRPVIEKSVDFEKTKNIYIEGDNFEALKIIQESYLNKIKMIYIDPPYNTGKDFIYKDNFKQSKDEYEEEIEAVDEEGIKLFKNTDSNGRFHSDWLSMMYERLLIARDLLREDGVIFISIDDNEVHNLRHLCDEVFGEGNFIGEIIPIVNPGGRDYKQIAIMHEYVLVYRKSEKASLNEISKNIDFKYEDLKGKYNLRELRNRNPKFTKLNRPNLFYPIYINPNIIDNYGCSPISLNKSDDYYIEIYPLNSKKESSKCMEMGKRKSGKKYKS